jgi:hypothetical protein
MIKKAICIISIILILCSCENEKPNFYKLVYKFQSEVENVKEGDVLPGNLIKYANYYEVTDEDSECFNQIYASEVEYQRTDLEEQFEVGMPISGTGKLQNSFGTLSAINLKAMYDLEKLTVSKLLLKKSKDVKSVEDNSQKNSFIVRINESKNNVLKYRSLIGKALCNGAKTINIIVVNEVETSKPIKIIESGDDRDNSKTITTDTKIIITPNPKPLVSKTEKISSDGVKWSKVKNKQEYRSDYASYYGGLKNGKMDGQGTMVFTKTHLIPVPKNSKKRITAARGYKLTGVFKNGSFVSGSLVDKNGGNKKAIFIGR